MATKITIDPVTRLEGHLKIDVTVDYVNGVQQVIDAHSAGTMFRGFETILKGRNPLDAPDITERICGVCPVSHGLAAVNTLEAAANIQVPSNARIMRNLVLGSNFLQSHILHFYHLALLDFVDGPAMAPWLPTWNVDKRITGTAAQTLVNNYLSALDFRRQSHEMGALFGGRLPHPPAFIPGGFTTTPRPARITKFQTYITTLINFINHTYLPDVATVAGYYNDYYSVGRGYGNLLAFGAFDLDSTGNNKLLKRGIALNGSKTIQAVSVPNITEQVTYSWYNDSTNNLPPASGNTLPVYHKAAGYSWMKAPRYGNAPYEAGPLARMWVNGDYQKGISVMDRHAARAQEALKVATALQTWVGQLTGASVYNAYITPASASAFGLTEAPRGALGHWLGITTGSIANYQVITPTCWNASPRDTAGVLGPLEKALIGTPVQDTTQPLEVLRVIHSFDPCLACAVHVMRPGEQTKIFALGGVE